MNVVLLHAHDAGRIVEPYGYPVPCPNLMRFARDGVLFRKAFAVSPTCGPSRAALTGGKYPHQLGMFGLPGPQGWTFADYGHHIVRAFNAWGYHTVLSGVQHEADHADFSCLGYQRVLESEAPARQQPGEFYPESINRVEGFLATHHRSQPFFLSIGIDEPHRDNIPRPELNLSGDSKRFSKTRRYDPELLDSRFTAPPPWLPDLPEIRRDMASYIEGTRLMDEYMGRVFYALKHNGFDQSTLVIVTSDHGIEFPGGKKTLNDQGTQVMMIMRGPADSGIHGGRVIEPLVTHLDLYPTICDLLNTEVEHKLEGKNLLPLIRGQVDKLHQHIFAEQSYHGQLEALRSVRSERYKYIRRYEEAGPAMRHDGPTTAVMEAVGWYDRLLGEEQLFDLYLDPLEACNRIQDAAYQPIKQQLSQVLEDWMLRTNDPFSQRNLPSPPGTADGHCF